MKIRLSMLALVAVSALLAARSAPADDAFDVKALKVKTPKEWEGEFNSTLKSWTYEKYIEMKGEDTRKPNRLYIDRLPEDAREEHLLLRW